MIRTLWTIYLIKMTLFLLFQRVLWTCSKKAKIKTVEKNIKQKFISSVLYSIFHRLLGILCTWYLFVISIYVCFPGASDGKESACNVGDLGLVPGLQRSPRSLAWQPIIGMATHSIILVWRIPMCRAWRAIIHGVAKSRSDRTEQLSTHTHMYAHLILYTNRAILCKLLCNLWFSHCHIFWASFHVCVFLSVFINF